MNRTSLSLLMILALAGVVVSIPPAASAYDYTYARVVRLSLVDGDVQVARPRAENDDQSTDSGWEQAVVNLPIQQGFSVATGQGRAEIEFENGATARLADNSLLQFTELALSNGGRITRLTLTQGTATFYANLSRGDSFVVASPHLQVVIPGNARFRLDVEDDSTAVSALKGDVEVDSRAGTNRLTKGNTLTYRASDPDRVAIERLARSDDWDRWVADRDEVIHTGDTAALQYVSSPYSYGLSDLSSYGSWTSFDAYGNCWRPYGVGFGWSPFSVGRWGFFPGLGWTWISYEPWGWLPYHFGRWVFSPTLGWLWVPGFQQRWHPGLVSWVRVGDRIGWVPLHPNDRAGQTPANIQQGVVLTGSKGFTSTDRFERRMISRGENIEVMRDLPPAFAEASRKGSKRTVGPPTAGSAGSGSDQRGIVFDSKERKFVNNPSAGAAKPNNRTDRKTNGIGDANMETGGPPTSRGTAGNRPSKPNNSPPSPPNKGVGVGPGGPAPTGDRSAPPRPASPPPSPPNKGSGVGPGGPAPTGDRSVPPRPASPPPPPPRAQTPPPPPRAQSSPPRAERSFARSESAHPAPRTESAPRSSSTSSSSQSSFTSRTSGSSRR